MIKINCYLIAIDILVKIKYECFYGLVRLRSEFCVIIILIHGRIDPDVGYALVFDTSDHNAAEIYAAWRQHLSVRCRNINSRKTVFASEMSAVSYFA